MVQRFSLRRGGDHGLLAINLILKLSTFSQVYKRVILFMWNTCLDALTLSGNFFFEKYKNFPCNRYENVVQ